MKKVKTYGTFIEESIRDKMIPKSKEDIIGSIYEQLDHNSHKWDACDNKLPRYLIDKISKKLDTSSDKIYCLHWTDDTDRITDTIFDILEDNFEDMMKDISTVDYHDNKTNRDYVFTCYRQSRISTVGSYLHFILFDKEYFKRK